jgi:hypothetical protein
MPEPVIPFGLTVAVTVMTVLSWYGTLRIGVQTIELDIQHSRSAAADIANCLTDLRHQEIQLGDWRKAWCLSEKAPDDLLLEFWGPIRFSLIKAKLKRIYTTLETARKRLKDYDGLDEEKWKRMSSLSRKRKKFTWIMRKRAHVQELVDSMPKDFDVVKRQAKEGWEERESSLRHILGYTTPFHTFMAYMLVKIAQQIRADADALCTLAQEVKQDYTITLDLDIFEASEGSTSNSKDKEAPQVYNILDASRLRLNLLLRDASREDEQLLRVNVQKVSQEDAQGGRVRDAVMALLQGPAGVQHICHVDSKPFGLSKSGDLLRGCSRLQLTLSNIVTGQDPLNYDHSEVCFRDQPLGLGDLSTCRAAFELAQACLLFLRTTWFAKVCRCGLRYGEIPGEQWRSEPRHHFGIEMGEIAHRSMSWRNPDGSMHPWEYGVEHCWCAQSSPWSIPNRPLRHLGLLIVELAFGQPVLVRRLDSHNEEPKVASLCILTKVLHGSPVWAELSVKVVLELVKKKFNNSDGVKKAVEFCLCGSSPLAPVDEDWEQYLKRFYFTVVKP